MLRIMIVSIFVFNLSIAFSFDSCGENSEEKKYTNLTWINVGNFFADSIVNVRGMICAGVTKDFFEVKRLHYRDDRGGEVYKDLDFFRTSPRKIIAIETFPGFARRFLRDADPLKLQVLRDFNQGDSRVYVARLQFVRNMGSSAYPSNRDDTRYLDVKFMVNHRLKRATSYYKNKQIDEIYLGIPGLRPRRFVLNELVFKFHNREVERMFSSSLRSL